MLSTRIFDSLSTPTTVQSFPLQIPSDWAAAHQPMLICVWKRNQYITWVEAGRISTHVRREGKPDPFGKAYDRLTILLPTETITWTSSSKPSSPSAWPSPPSRRPTFACLLSRTLPSSTKVSFLSKSLVRSATTYLWSATWSSCRPSMLPTSRSMATTAWWLPLKPRPSSPTPVAESSGAGSHWARHPMSSPG